MLSSQRRKPRQCFLIEPRQAWHAKALQRHGRQAWQARRGRLQEHLHQASRHSSRPASLMKNRRLREHNETRSESSSLSGVSRHNSERGKECRDIGSASEANRTDDPSAKAAAASKINRKQEVLRLITCEQQRNPLNARSQSGGAYQPYIRQARQQQGQRKALLEVRSELWFHY